MKKTAGHSSGGLGQMVCANLCLKQPAVKIWSCAISGGWEWWEKIVATHTMTMGRKRGTTSNRAIIINDSNYICISSEKTIDTIFKNRCLVSYLKTQHYNHHQWIWFRLIINPYQPLYYQQLLTCINENGISTICFCIWLIMIEAALQVTTALQACSLAREVWAGWWRVLHLRMHIYIYIIQLLYINYIPIYVYIYICMYVCMYVCMDVWMLACMHACMHACMYVCMYVILSTYVSYISYSV